MKILFVLLAICFSTIVFAKKDIKYEYKKYEKFDLGAIDIEGVGAFWPLQCFRALDSFQQWLILW